MQADNPIDELRVFDLRESMANGGGTGLPASARGVNAEGDAGR